MTSTMKWKEIPTTIDSTSAPLKRQKQTPSIANCLAHIFVKIFIYHLMCDFFSTSIDLLQMLLLWLVWFLMIKKRASAINLPLWMCNEISLIKANQSMQILNCTQVTLINWIVLEPKLLFVPFTTCFCTCLFL